MGSQFPQPLSYPPMPLLVSESSDNEEYDVGVLAVDEDDVEMQEMSSYVGPDILDLLGI